MRDFSRSLPMAMMRAREAVMCRFRPLLRAAGVTEQQWRVLRALADERALEITHLSQRTCLLMPSMSRILQTLESKGLVCRQVVRNDQRRTLISITRAGRGLIAKVGPHSEERYAEIARLVGEARLAELQDLLDAVTTALERDEG